MFTDRNATAMLPARDIHRAKNWYREKLGIVPVDDLGDTGARYRMGGGTPVFLYPTPFAGTAGHTLLSFSCTDLVADMAALRGRGVEFIEYDMPGLKTQDGVARFGPVKNAWAKDSEGNILGFVEGM